MPGMLKPDAKCPKCGEALLMIARCTTPNINLCTLTFIHTEPGWSDHEMAGTIEAMDKIHDALHTTVNT